MSELPGVVIAGASGRMGQMLIQSVLESNKMRLVGVLERPGHDWVGRDVGEAMGGHLTKSDIAVSVVCPGYIRTDMITRSHSFRPFTMTVEQAADKTKRAFDRLKTYAAFPLGLVLITIPARWLPAGLRRLATGGFGFKKLG